MCKHRSHLCFHEFRFKVALPNSLVGIELFSYWPSCSLLLGGQNSMEAMATASSNASSAHCAPMAVEAAALLLVDPTTPCYLTLHRPSCCLALTHGSWVSVRAATLSNTLP